jgi:hypothetical protein
MRVLKSQAHFPLKRSLAVLLLLPALACHAAAPDENPAAVLSASPAVAPAMSPTVAPAVSAPGSPAVSSSELPVFGAVPAQVESGPESKVGNVAVAAAVADGVTTAFALSSGAMETNPLIATSPLGLIAITGAKILLAKYAETLPEQQKRLVIKTTTAVWSGAAINNIMVLLSAPPPFPIIAGIVMGFTAWKYTGKKYEQEDVLTAARAKATPAAPAVAPVTPAAPDQPAAPADPVAPAAPDQPTAPADPASPAAPASPDAAPAPLVTGLAQLNYE